MAAGSPADGSFHDRLRRRCRTDRELNRDEAAFGLRSNLEARFLEHFVWRRGLVESQNDSINVGAGSVKLKKRR